MQIDFSVRVIYYYYNQSFWIDMKTFAFQNIYLTSCYSLIIILLVIKHRQVQSIVELFIFMTIIYHLGSYTEIVWTFSCQPYVSLYPLYFS